MALSLHDVGHIARLARLALIDEERARYGNQLTSILDYVGELQSVATEGVEPTNTVSGAVNVSRKDEVACIPGEIAHKKFLSQSTMRDGDYLKVPGVFGKSLTLSTSSPTEIGDPETKSKQKAD